MLLPSMLLPLQMHKEVVDNIYKLIYSLIASLLGAVPLQRVNHPAPMLVPPGMGADDHLDPNTVVSYDIKCTRFLVERM